MPPLHNMIFEVLGLLFGFVILIKLWKDPNKFYFMSFLFAVLMTTLIELTGIREHHSYYYDDFLFVIPETTTLASLVGGTGRDFPIFIAVQWAIIVYCLSLMVQRLSIRWYMAPLVGGLVATSIDMAIDPVAASSRVVQTLGDFCYGSTVFGDTEGVGYWVWCIPMEVENVYFFGVPLQNFYAWFLVVAVWMFFQGIAYNQSYHGSWSDQFNALVTSTVLAMTVFFSVLADLMELGAGFAWAVWGGLMLLGLGVLVNAGISRTAYDFDWWAYSVLIAATVFCVLSITLRLWGSASATMLLSTVVWVVIFLLLGAWILLGKRMLGHPYP